MANEMDRDGVLVVVVAVVAAAFANSSAALLSGTSGMCAASYQ